MAGEGEEAQRGFLLSATQPTAKRAPGREKALMSTPGGAVRSPGNTWVGLGRRKGGETRMEDYGECGIMRNRSWAGATNCEGGRTPPAPRIFGLGGDGPMTGLVGFHKA